MVCLVLNGGSLPGSDVLVRALREIPGMASIYLNINKENTNVILGKKLKLLWGQEYIEDQIHGLTFRISPLSFYQVNPFQTEKLYGKALEYAGLTGQETVWDLYCGTGTISLFLAGRAKQVYGVEIVSEAIRDARENAARNHIANAEFYTGKAEEILPGNMSRKGFRRTLSSWIRQGRAVIPRFSLRWPESVRRELCTSAAIRPLWPEI